MALQKKQQLNPELLNTLKDLDDGQFFGELIGIFLQHAPQLISELETAVQANQSREIHIAAHKLKGSCANMGAEIMAELASFLEKGVLPLSTADRLALVQRLWDEWSIVRQCLEQEIVRQRHELGSQRQRFPPINAID